MILSLQNTTNSGFSSPVSGTGQKSTQTSAGGPKKELTQEEKDQVKQLKRSDQEVRAHEMAHMAAGGGLVRGGAKFEYETGPDGRQYAIAGEVSIDTSPVSGDPRATIMKMQRVQSAAMAPANPSGQDRQVAAQAAATAAKAQMELAKEGLSSANEGEEGKTEAVKNLYTRNGQIQRIDIPDPAGMHLDLYF